MKILVTGGAGFIGTNLCKRLLKDNYEVWSFDNYSTGNRENEIEGVKYCEIDVTNGIKDGAYFDKVQNAWVHTKEFDVIFHMAALARIQPSINNPVKCLENNFNGTLNILEYARQHNTQVIYAGSSSKHHNLYGSPYAWSKYSGEQLCKLYSEVYGLNTSICRFYNVYGPHHIRSGNYATVLGIFEKQYLDNEPLTITGNGEQRRDFTHIDDIVSGLLSCVGKEHKAEEFELGSGKNYSINEVADIFDCETTYIPERPGEYDVTLCDYSKAENILGYKPMGNLKTYIKQWIEENK